MKHLVRRVTSEDRKKTLGFGVFPGWNVCNIAEEGSVNIKYCTDPEDSRPLKDQWGKTYRMKGLYPAIETAHSKALQLTAQKVQPR